MNYLVAVDASFVHAPGGMARVAWDMAGAARDRGHEVGMICAHAPGEATPTVEEVENIRIAHYPRPRLPNWDPRYLRRMFANMHETMGRFLSRHRWDVVHSHSPFSGLGAMNSLGPSTPCVSTIHSPVVLERHTAWDNEGYSGRLKKLLMGPVLGHLEGRLLRSSARLHALSEYTRRQMARFHGRAVSQKIAVVPHWCREEQRRTVTRQQARDQLGWPPDKKIFFTLRVLGERYGIDKAIGAIGPQTLDGSCVFYIAGDGPTRQRLEEQAARMGCGTGVQFMGRISDETMALAYQAADLFVLPTLTLECFGLIILEALSFGCPVLSTDAGAIPETMRDILPDFIVRAGDQAALQVKVRQFLDGTLRPPAEEELLRYVQRRYHRRVVIPRLFELIEGTTNPRKQAHVQ